MKKPHETILIVEDDENDALFIQRAFANKEENPFPRVIITDLKMPQMDGLQLLRWLAENRECRVVPTIVFTSSTAQSDVNEAFNHGAGAYIVKPIDIRELDRVAKIIADYWRLSLLPDQSG